jgi:RNA exonuclease 1
MWSCCGKHVSSDPCKGHEFHIPRNYSKGKLESAWKFHTTPDTYTSSTIRPAVAIDCEMGTARSGDSELIRVTLIDYFSSAILVDSLVYPDVAMEHYNTRFSGVTTGQMKLARKQGRCLMGKEQARAEVWKFVGPNTVVVGHSAHNDLTAMRWIHPVVVDTWLIESIKAKAAKTKAEQEKKEPDSTSPVSINVARKPKADQQKRPKKRGKGSGALSLKTLTMARCGREIQTAGKKGHDSLEDATAARDLAHWNIVNKGF